MTSFADFVATTATGTERAMLRAARECRRKDGTWEAHSCREAWCLERERWIERYECEVIMPSLIRDNPERWQDYNGGGRQQ